MARIEIFRLGNKNKHDLNASIYKKTICLTFGLLNSVGPRLDTCLVQWEGEGAVGGGGQGGGADKTTRGAAEGAQGEQPPFYHSGAGETAQRANGSYLESTVLTQYVWIDEQKMRSITSPSVSPLATRYSQY